MPHREVVIDACCTLKLLATERAEAIMRALEWQLVDTPHVSVEPMCLWTPPDVDGVRAKRPTSTELLRATGLLGTRALDTEALIDAFVAAAARINDADASCIALAGVLGLPLVTDDRKERRIAIEMFPSTELVSTLDVLHEASIRIGWSASELAQAAKNLRWGGNFAPPNKDPRAGWYSTLLART